MKKTTSRLLRSCFDLLFWCLCFLAVFGSCHRPVETVHEPSPDLTLVSIDSLMWQSPDSAFALLLGFASDPRSDSLGVFDGHYFQLLVSELLYKNDCEQTNRSALLQSVDYFDSLTGVRGGDASPAAVFLDARAHYIKGVGCYERDSVVEACAEYLKSVEVMESRFDEADLTGQKAKFMALSYLHLTQLYSDQYLHEQAIYFGRRSLPYFEKHDATSWHPSWALEMIGSHFDMLERWDSAYCYYNKALEVLPDTNNLTFRDIKTGIAYFSYHNTREKPNTVLKQLYELLAKSESEKEYVARCLIVGDVYYQEREYDSAWSYLTKVFAGSDVVDLKKQAASELVDIGRSKGEDIGLYADFLLELATSEEEKSVVRSQLDEMHEKFRYNTAESEHKTVGNMVTIVLAIMAGLTLIVLAIAFHHHSNNKKTRNINTETHIDEQSPTPAWNRYEQFLNEPVCKRIVLSIQGKSFKRVLIPQAYREYALTDTQLQQLSLVVNRYYGSFDALLKQQGLSVTPTMVNLCHLYMLGMDNKQASVLLKMDYSSISRCCNQLRIAFNTQENMTVFMRKILINT